MRIQFFQRVFPSANMALIRGPRPILVDPGYGADLATTIALLHEAGVAPESLALIVNTHYHGDHCGGNGGLQARYGTPIAAHAWEAGAINRRDAEACAAAWLDQPVEPYRVQQILHDGDLLETGVATVRIIHVPGHTLGLIALYVEEEATLICGDAFHGDDVAWINPYREGPGALERALASLERLAGLRLARAYSGHSPPMDDPLAAIDAARRRYERWASEPERLGWHACKRIFAYALMIRGGLSREQLHSYLLACPWFQDYSRGIFGVAPADFVRPLIEEMLRSGAAGWAGPRLVALGAHTAPSPGWPLALRPRDWPRH